MSNETTEKRKGHTFGSFASPDGSSDGMVVNFVPLNLAESFGTSPYNLYFPAVDIEHVRTRIYLPQVAVSIKGMQCGGPRKPLGRYSLDDITGNDMFFQSGHKAFVAFFANI
jgi:hypothetical protein